MRGRQWGILRVMGGESGHYGYGCSKRRNGAEVIGKMGGRVYGCNCPGGGGRVVEILLVVDGLLVACMAVVMLTLVVVVAVVR